MIHSLSILFLCLNKKMSSPEEKKNLGVFQVHMQARLRLLSHHASCGGYEGFSSQSCLWCVPNYSFKILLLRDFLRRKCTFALAFPFFAVN